MGDERAHERRLADTRRPGHADRRCVARRRIDAPDDLLAVRRAVLDERDRARERAAVSGEDAGDERVLRPLGACHRGDSTERGGPRRRGGPASRTHLGRAFASLLAPPGLLDLVHQRAEALEARRLAAPARLGLRDVARPAREDDREHGSRRGRRTPAIAQAVARARGVDEQAGARHREAEHGVVARHEHRERAAAHRVRRAPLHEHLVADDRGAVADRRDAGEHGGNGDRRRGRGDAEADAHHQQRAAVHAASCRARPSADAAKKLPKIEPDPGRRDEEAEPEVAGADLVLGERDLGDVDECRRDSRPCSRRRAP